MSRMSRRQGSLGEVLQVTWLMGAPAGLKLHAELSSLLGTAALALLRATRACYAALAPALLPRMLGAADVLPSHERRANLPQFSGPLQAKSGSITPGRHRCSYSFTTSWEEIPRGKHPWRYRAVPFATLQ